MPPENLPAITEQATGMDDLQHLPGEDLIGKKNHPRYFTEGFTEAGRQTLAVNQNEELSNEVFSANAQFSAAGGQVNQARADIQSANNFIEGGQTIIRNLPASDRVGTFASNRLVG